MSESKTTGTLRLKGASTLRAPRRIVLKKTVDEGSINQSFSHGRTKSVSVEVRKKRTFIKASKKKEILRKPVETGAEIETRSTESADPSVDSSTTDKKEPKILHPVAVDRVDSREELPIQEPPTRKPVLVEPSQRSKQPEQQARQKPRSTRSVQPEQPAQQKLTKANETPPDTPRRKKPLTKAQKAEVARKKSDALISQRLSELEEMRQKKRRQEEILKKEALKAEKQAKATKAATVSQKQKPGKLSGKPFGKKQRDRSKRKVASTSLVQEAAKAFIVREVVIPEMISVSELASRMAVKAGEVVKTLFKMGVVMTINQSMDQETAVLVVEEMGHRSKTVSESAAIEETLAEHEDLEENMISHPPVVTVMGHVDHGKTSLLDAIRKTDVTMREFGGITQHIGAYQVTMESGARITFLDTPGHAAFTSMRARGAQVTDLIVLVVAADDGVMPQTVEAIHHAKEAHVPVLVAVNKMDKPEADPEQVMRQLTEYELVAERWGGDTVFVPVSAKTGDGLELLEEMILLQSEMLDLKANVNQSARGVIVESRLDKGRGAVATCLVQSGTLRVGDVFVVGREWGRARGLSDDKATRIRKATPATPVEITGLSGVPEAGDALIVVPDERRAREIALFRQNKHKEKLQARRSQTNLNDLFAQAKEDDRVSAVKVVVKADTHGSAEAVSDALKKIQHDEVRMTVIHVAAGGINESDVMLASASDAVVVGFNVRVDAKARALAAQESVELRFYAVIYTLIDEMKQAMEGLLEPAVEEKQLGRAEVREVFRIGKVGAVAGCRVIEGLIRRDALVRLLRDNIVVLEKGTVSSLKRFQDDVNEVRNGMECGIGLYRFNDIKQGDIIEIYTEETFKKIIA